MRQLGQYPPPRHVLAHISDTHLLSGGKPLFGEVATERNLSHALEKLERSGIRPEALVFTGDLADLGEPDAYERLLAIVRPVADRIGAQLVWVMGNHDEREPYSRILFGTEGAGPQDRVHETAGLRIVSIDTSVPGYHHGEISPTQLEWLRDVLRTPAPHGTVLAMHHPPIPTPLEVMATLELERQHELADVIRGTDVRVILAGHLHYSTHSTFAGIPVAVGAATCYTLDFTAPERLLSGVDGAQAFALVHVYDDRVVHSLVPIGDFAEVSAVPANLAPAIEAMSPDERRERLSSKTARVNLGDGA